MFVLTSYVYRKKYTRSTFFSWAFIRLLLMPAQKEDVCAAKTKRRVFPWKKFHGISWVELKPKQQHRKTTTPNLGLGKFTWPNWSLKMTVKSKVKQSIKNFEIRNQNHLVFDSYQPTSIDPYVFVMAHLLIFPHIYWIPYS